MRYQSNARLVLPFSFGDLLSCVLVLWFGSYACVYIGDEYGVKPLYSYFVLIGYAALRFLRVAAVGQLPLAVRSHATQAYLFWLSAYLIYGCWAYLRSSQSDIAFQALCTLFEAVVLGASFTFMLASHARIRQVQTQVAVLAIFAFAAIVGLGFLYLIFVGDLGSFLVDSEIGQYLDRNTLGRLGLSGSAISGDASDERKDVALYALDQFYAHPFAGNGLGYVYEWEYSVGPHNMFLLFMAEGGVVGLALYLWLCLALWRSAQGVGRVMVMLILAGSLFAHNLTEQPAVLLVFAFVFAHGAITRRDTRRSHQQVPIGHPA